MAKKKFLEFDAQTTRREDARGAATANSHSSISIRTIGANPARVSADRVSQKSTDTREKPSAFFSPLSAKKSILATRLY
jgi:hypothetical protein